MSQRCKRRSCFAEDGDTVLLVLLSIWTAASVVYMHTVITVAWSRAASVKELVLRGAAQLSAMDNCSLQAGAWAPGGITWQPADAVVQLAAGADLPGTGLYGGGSVGMQVARRRPDVMKVPHVHLVSRSGDRQSSWLSCWDSKAVVWMPVPW